MKPHAALMNVDILHEIFAHLALLPSRHETWLQLPESEKGNRTVLLSAALSCKTLSSPALDALWWKIDDICHLLHVLPAFHLSGQDYVLDGHITEQDWKRFDSYAKRVRYLVFHDFCTIHSSVFLRLAQLKKFSPLIPNVQAISSRPGGSGLLSVLSTSLLDLDIRPDNSDGICPTVWPCLEALPDTSPNLRTLLVQATLSPTSLKAFPRMSNIQCLYLLNARIHDLDFFYSLSKLEHVKLLVISGFEEPTATITTLKVTDAWTAQPFPALRKLVITSDAPSVFSVLFEIFQHHPLQLLDLHPQSLRIDHTLVASNLSTEWSQVIRDISSKFCSLKDLTIVGSTNGTQAPLFTVFEPLLGMHEFELIDLDFPCLPFSNADLQQVASAWPKLIKLRLTGSQGPLNATLEALMAFAVGCPKLQDLSLEFDASYTPSMGDVSIFSNELKTLDVQNSPIHSALSVARYLDRMFPNLETIHANDCNSTWSEVGVLIEMFRAVRMDQKARDAGVMERARLA
ncbi:hypothetical protein H2248_001744 [Termitomyces sp. 'cryptogamus']|nr:hypothetical protein H2248_001744 [Termitomyces sp. 'cryptogamus']